MDKTVAILSRTNRSLRIFEELLSSESIKYHLIGRSGYWSAPEVRSCLAWLHCVIYPADWCVVQALRSPFEICKYLPKTKIAQRLKELKDADDSTSYWNLLTKEPHSLVESRNVGALVEFMRLVGSLVRYRNLPAQEAVRQVLGALKAFDYFGEEETSPDNDPISNLQELVKLSGKYSTLKEFLDYTRRASAASKGKRGVALGTCHSAKGLEFNTVHLVGVQEGMFPHTKSDDLDGERNCLFVGISRAERELIVSYAGSPSPFIRHLVQKTEGETK